MVLLEAFLDGQTLGRDRGGGDHPSFVIEVTQDDLHTSTNFTERMRYWYSDLLARRLDTGLIVMMTRYLIESNVCCASYGGVSRLDLLR